MSGDSFYNAREEFPKPYEQSGREEQAEDITPTTDVSSQTRLIGEAVQGLDMNAEENKDTGMAGMQEEFGTRLDRALATMLIMV